MVNIAIAGGTGGVGRSIAEVLAGHPSHQAVIFSRRNRNDENSRLPLVEVDYTDVEGLKVLLEKHQINTVICTFAIEGNSLSTSQINLIRASAMSSATRRFIPSSFAIPYPRDYVDVLPPLKYYFDSLDELKKTDLEWTVVLNGTFMDYFGAPHLKSYLKPNVFVIDMENNAAAIPGDGKNIVTLTYSLDVARFVVAALDLETWPQETRIVGDQITWNDFVKLAEEARGAKFDVHYDDVEKLRNFQITELPSHRALYDHFPKEKFQWFMSIFELWTAVGLSHVPSEGALNEKFPHIKPLTVKELLDRFWKEKKE